MRKLSESIVSVTTEIYSYDTFEEYNIHFEQMQANGWVGATNGGCESHWMTTYTLRETNTTILSRL